MNANGTLYYRTYKNSGYSLAKREPGKAEEILWIETRPAFLTTDGNGNIYFSDGQNANKILQINENTGEGRIISDNCGLYLCIIDGFLYYTNHDDRDRVYRVNLSTLEEERYIQAAAFETATDGKNLYFINGDDNFNVYSAKISGDSPELTRLNEENSRSLCYSNGMLIYTGEDGRLRAMNTAGRQAEMNCSVKARGLTTDGKWVVIVEEETHRVCAYNLDTESTVSLGGDNRASYAWVSEGTVYAVSYSDISAVNTYDIE